MDVLVLQHVACEPPGVYEDVLLARGLTLTRVELDEGESLPDWRDHAAMIVMGGPMGAYDEADHPWLVAEKQAIGAAVRAGVPFFGACLGVQLLADAVGGRAFPGGTPEVGVLPVRLTDAGRADPVLGGIQGEFPTLQWHGDTFELPPGAVRLAESDAYPNQAMRIGELAYGVQFHLEVTDAMAAEWSTIPAYEQALASVRGPGSLGPLLDEVSAQGPRMRTLAAEIFGRWLDLWV